MTQTSDSYKIEVRNAYKVFGRRRDEAVEALRAGTSRQSVLERTGALAAVIDASLQVRAGEIFVVMGLSGSGKSTLVRMINRLHEPTAGSIHIDGVDVTALGPKELRVLRAERISMVFQHFALLPHRTVRDNAAFGLEARGVEKAERLDRASEALGMVGLDGWGDSYPSELSGGMQQRVGLARALATQAEILLMDEAFSALDPLIRREMQDQLVELQDTLQRTIVFITHDLNEAMRLGDRIAMLREGRIVQVGTAEEILQEPADDYVATFVQDVDRSRVLTADAVMVEPVARIFSHEGPAQAMRKMRELQVSAVFVVGPDHHLVGRVRDEPVARALQRHQHDFDGLLEPELVTVPPDAVLADLFAPAAESPLPLPVVDDSGRLLGVIPRVTLLGALGGAPTGEVPVVPPSAAGANGDEPTVGDGRREVVTDA